MGSAPSCLHSYTYTFALPEKGAAAFAIQSHIRPFTAGRSTLHASWGTETNGKQSLIVKVAWTDKEVTVVDLSDVKIHLFSVQRRRILSEFSLLKKSNFMSTVDGTYAARFSEIPPGDSYALHLMITEEAPSPNAVATPSPTCDLATLPSIAAALDTRHPHDVRLVFPREKKELWTSSALLKTRSSYFRSILDSDFAEGSTKTVPSNTGDAAGERSAFDDSDDEGEVQIEPKVRKQASCDAPFHEVVIVDASYHSYRAILVWMASGHISFAPLTSSTIARGYTIPQIQAMRREQPTSNKSSIPRPVSAKSVYRLAHFLSLPDLAEHALREYRAQLTSACVTYELCSDVVAAYDQLGDAVASFAASQWDAVKLTKGFEVMMRADEGQMSTDMSLKLMSKLKAAN